MITLPVGVEVTVNPCPVAVAVTVVVAPTVAVIVPEASEGVLVTG